MGDLINSDDIQTEAVVSAIGEENLKKIKPMMDKAFVGLPKLIGKGKALLAIPQEEDVIYFIIDLDKVDNFEVPKESIKKQGSIKNLINDFFNLAGI